MKRRTLRLDDLKTLAAVCHKYDAINWPPRAEGGWATATLNGHPYKARVEPQPEITDMREPGEAFCANCPDHEACMTNWPCSLVKRVNRQETP